MKRTHNLFTIAATGLALSLSTQMGAAQSASATAQSNISITAQEVLMAQNQTYLDVLANLEASGYEVIEMSRTWLGRIKIEARNAVHLREVVVSSSTGEVMSDVIVEIFAQNESPETVEGEEAGTGLVMGATVGLTGGASTGSGGSSAGGSVTGGVSISIGN